MEIESTNLKDAKLFIAKQVAALIPSISPEDILTCIEEPKSGSSTTRADLCIPLGRLNRFAKLPGAPLELCKTWADQIPTNEIITTVTGESGYLNFKVSSAHATQTISDLLKEILSSPSTWGCNDEGKGKRVIVEFSSPNIAKPFHCGHLRSTILGNVLKNLYKACGYDVVALNYLGDWGKQYGLLAIGFERYGSEEKFQENAIRHLFEIYVKINEDKKKDPAVDDEARAYFKRMEEGDAEILKVWRRFREMSIDEYKKIYSRLNVSFDEYSGESMFPEEMKKELAKLEDQKLLVESDGARVVDLKEFGLDVAIAQKRDGTTLYITRDIAAAHARKEKYKFDEMFYVVAAQQNHHFKQLFAILKKMGYEWSDTCHHVNFGMVKGMSTRTGNVVFLEEILEEAKTTMLEIIKKNESKWVELEDPELIADQIGISAVVVQDLSARRVKDYAFDWKRMTSFEGDTGPYLLYTHARLCSMQRKAETMLSQEALGSITKGGEEEELAKCLTEEDAVELFKIIAKFPMSVKQARQSQEPCVLVAYLMNLCHKISHTLEKLRVVGETNEKLSIARLAMYHCARITLRSGIQLLGLVPVERM